MLNQIHGIPMRVIWSNTNGIAAGIGNGLFGTNNNVTREQLATILYNYAKYKGYDVTKTVELNDFADASAISDWAQSAAKWANAEELITGRTTDTFAPGDGASRAEGGDHSAAVRRRTCEIAALDSKSYFKLKIIRQ